MQIKELFQKDIKRKITGVIIADDHRNIQTEIDEYVLTYEIKSQLDNLLESYINNDSLPGVWISGFFGTGKSHLLKMISLLLEGWYHDDFHIADVMMHKCDDDQILKANIGKVKAIPAQSILFNIDQKADTNSPKDTDAILNVFVKVFNEACGYYGKHAYIVKFERDLDRQGILEEFKVEYKIVSGKDWKIGRVMAEMEDHNVSKAYASIKQVSESSINSVLSNYSKNEIKELLEYAMENRKRVKDQLMRIDKTYEAVRFAYTDLEGNLHFVKTAEEIQYPSYYYGKEVLTEEDKEPHDEQTGETGGVSQSEQKEDMEEPILKPRNIAIQDNQTGISYRILFSKYLKGSKRIEIKDPFVGSFYQCRNLMEFMEVVAAIKSDTDEVEVHLITKHSEYQDSNQEEYFRQIESSCSKVGITFTYEIDDTIYDRYIQSYNGWKIIPGRGLDIFHKFDDKDAFAMENRN